MVRKPRIDLAGLYHIIDHGINRSNVFSCSQDKDKFLQIFCKACSTYKVNVHDYCLMDNDYHLLIRNKNVAVIYGKVDISLIMFLMSLTFYPCLCT